MNHTDILEPLKKISAENPTLKVPPMGSALSDVMSDLKPISLRKPHRELTVFLGLSLPFFILFLLIIGIRRDLSELSPFWLGSVIIVWSFSYVASSYLGFVPVKGHVMPRTRNIRHFVIASSLLMIAIGFFASETTAGINYPNTFSNFIGHATKCSLVGLGTAIIPGIITLLLMRRFVPVGRTAIGLSLGAAGGAIAGLALLLHCPISERFHVGIVHGSTIAIAAIFVARVSQILLKEKS